MTLTYRFFVLILILGLPFNASLAQDAVLRIADPPRAYRSLQFGSPVDIHVTGDAQFFPDEAEAREKYREAQASGFVPMRKTAVVDTIGAERAFNVRTNILSAGTADWESLTFVLRATSDAANVWVASDLTGDFSPSDMAQLEAYILSETPEDSYRPDSGIIENDNDTFGDPPSFVDDDGRVDILMHDIKEGEGNDCCVLGYVTRADLDPTPEPGRGNASNMLYIDLPQGMSVSGVYGIAGTIAHEYQHLIHYAYAPTDEYTFINEGMSEWAEVVNGFFSRTINYLKNPDEHNTRLFAWRSEQSTAVVDRDYQRAGLFTTYIADRIGRAATGSIVRATCPDGDPTCPKNSYVIGVKGYDVVLADTGLTFKEVLADFNAANFINDRTYGDAFGYAIEQRRGLRAVATETIDGQIESAPSTHSIVIQHGAYRYISWTNVSDLQLAIADKAGAGIFNRSRGTLRLFTEPENGLAEVIDLDPEAESVVLDGAFDRVTLILSHVNPEDPDLSNPPALQLDVTATWDGGGAFSAESVAYDNGKNDLGIFYFFPEDNVQANGFDVPQNGRLSTVSVAPVYENQFDNGPDAGLPRDFRVTVWADDGTGRPGAEIYTETVEESTSAVHVTFGSMTYSLLEVELSDAGGVLEELPERIYVGISNAGDDENRLVLATAGTAGGDPASFVYDAAAGAWVSISEYRDEVVGQTFPIRAKFLIPTAAESIAELPTHVTLDQNYPNPFNPATTIAYSLPRPTHVRLAVYNMLGQRVAMLVDGRQSAGPHEMRVDATDWASGVYVYALETETQTFTQRMVVLR